MKSKPSKIILSLLVFALFAATSAWAAESSPSGLSSFLTDTVLPLISTLAVGFLTNFLRTQAKKSGLEVNIREQEALEQAARVAISFAEEKARDAINRDLPKMSGNSKLALAVDHVLRAVPKVDRRRATEVVRGLLFDSREAGQLSSRLQTVS